MRALFEFAAYGILAAGLAGVSPAMASGPDGRDDPGAERQSAPPPAAPRPPPPPRPDSNNNGFGGQPGGGAPPPPPPGGGQRGGPPGPGGQGGPSSGPPAPRFSAKRLLHGIRALTVRCAHSRWYCCRRRL